MVAYAETFAPASRPGRYPLALLVIIFLYIFLEQFSLEPLQAADIFGQPIWTEESFTQHTGEGSLLNQLFWLTMFAAALPLIWHRRRRVAAILRANLPLLMVMGYAALSIAWAIEPDLSFRRFAKFVIVVATVVGLVASLPEPHRFARAVLVATGIVIVANLLAALVLPHLSWNYDGEFVGVFRNKNTAGQFGMIAAVFWVCALLNARGLVNRAIGAVFALAALAIIALSVSKTVMAILPLAVPFAFLMHWAIARGPGMVTLVLAGLLLVVLSATVPFWLVDPIKVVGAVYGDPTLTGRIGIWQFLSAEIARSPAIGHGYESFWNIGDAAPAFRSPNWLLQTINQGHNGYLDVIVHLGYIGLALVLVMVLVPFFQLATIAKAPPAGGSVIMTAVFSALMVVTLLHNITESSFLRSTHAMWLFTLFSILYISAAAVDARRQLGRR